MGKKKSWLSLYLTMIGILLLPAAVAFGQTGKIAGQITDAETGNPMPGVNVILQGTEQGAATDADGHYYIINIPPGTYNVSARMIGYQEVTKTGVLVETNHTSQVDFQLETTVIAGQSVTVEAEREVINMDRSASEITSQSQEIDETVAIKDIGEYINQQVGVEGLSVRGGSMDQTQFMMDGLTVVDNRRNQPLMMVNLSSIQELSVIKGGFQAEYGNLRSGLINVVTKSGSPDHFSGSLDLRGSPARYKHAGAPITNWKNWYMRPYLDPAVAFVGTSDDDPNDGDGVSPWSQDMRDTYEEFEGWNAIADRYNTDDDPTNNMTAEEAQQRFLWRHAAEGSGELGQQEITYGDKPDYYIDGSLSGPLPFISQYLGNLTFFASHTTNKELFGLPVLRDYYSTQNSQLKLTSRITNNLKVTLEGIYNVENSVASGSNSYYSSGMGPLYAQNGFNDHLYWVGEKVPYDIYRSMGGLSIDHVLSENTFYNFRLSAVHVQDLARGPARWRDTTTVRKFGNYPVSEVPWGYWWFGGHYRMVDRQVYQGGGAGARNWTETNSVNAKFDITSQLNRYNQVKAGIEYNYDDLNVHYEHIRFDLPVQNWKVKWRHYPYRFGAYLQDKLEFRGLIANLGLRVDQNSPNSDWYLVNDPYSKYFRPAYRDVFTEVAPTGDVSGHTHLSPRIGISHPISAVSKLYFNYGHFYSMPLSENMYEISYSNPNRGIDFLGNPAADMPRTVAYELGYEHEIGQTWLVHVSGYYKDITSQTGGVQYTNYDGTVDYGTVENNNYQDIRGFEIQVRKRYGQWITGWANYDYRVVTSGYFGREHYYQDPRQQKLYGLQNPYQEKPLARPVARAHLMVHSPQNWGPQVAGMQPLGGVQLGLLFNYKAGIYQTWDPLDTGELLNNIQWKPQVNFDMRLSKRAVINNMNLQIFADIYNVFNIQQIFYTEGGVFPGFSDGTDRFNYLKSLHLPMYNDEKFKTAGYTPGNDRPGDKKNADKPYIDMPDRTFLTYLNNRYIEFGIRVDF